MPQIKISSSQAFETFSGNDLIKKLSALSPEQRQLPVVVEGEECFWTLDSVSVEDLPDHINGEYLDNPTGQAVILE